MNAGLGEESIISLEVIETIAKYTLAWINKLAIFNIDLFKVLSINHTSWMLIRWLDCIRAIGLLELEWHPVNGTSVQVYILEKPSLDIYQYGF